MTIESNDYCWLCGDGEEAIIHHLDEDDEVGHKFESARQHHESGPRAGDLTDASAEISGKDLDSRK